MKEIGGNYYDPCSGQSIPQVNSIQMFIMFTLMVDIFQNYDKFFYAIQFFLEIKHTNLAHIQNVKHDKKIRFVL